MKNIIALDCETTIEAKQKLRVITVKEFGKDSEILYRYDLHGDNISPEVVEYLKDKTIIAHNAWFDVGVLNAHGITVAGCWCTFMAEMIISDGAKMVNLADLVQLYKGIEVKKDEQKSDWGQALTDEQIAYCHEDVRHLEDIYKEQLAYITLTGQLPHTLLMNSVINAWAVDLYYGFPVDEKELTNIGNKCVAAYRKIIDKLISRVDVKLFLKGTYSVKAIKEALSPHTAILVDISKKNVLETMLAAGHLDDALKQLILENPLGNDLLLQVSSASFAKKLAVSYGLDFEKHDEATMTKYVDDYPDCDFSQVMALVLESRGIMKVFGTYSKLPEDQTYTDSDGLVRLKLKNSYTVSSRIGLVPLSVMPKSDDPSDFKYYLRDCYIPPKGYKTLSMDFAALEDVVSGVIFNDHTKLRSVDEGFDLHLLFASKLFKTFTYDDPSQTAELKKKYKAFRELVKAINHARNYGAGEKKLESMINAALQSEGIDMHITGQELIEAWSETFPGVAAAQQKINDEVSHYVQKAYEMFNYSRDDVKLMKEFTRDVESPASKLRKSVLADSRLNVFVGSVLGMRRDFIAHKWYYGIPLGSKKARVTDAVNYIIQTSSTQAMWLSLLMIKKHFPSIIIGAEIHDSLIMFVPENGIGDMSLEDIKESVAKLMGLSGYMLFGRHLKATGDYFVKGF